MRRALIFVLSVFAGCSSHGGGSHAAASMTATAPATSATPAATTSAATPTPVGLLGDPLSAVKVSGTTELRDALGRQILMRGLNLSERSKKPPFAGWLTPAHVENFVRLGFDHARFLITWEAVEPQDGVFDDAYLDQVKTELSWLEARGVRAVVDMHQDCFSRRFGGDGVPDWVLLAPDPYPLVPDVLGTFPANYANPKVIANFGDFWSSATKRSRFAKAWGHVVSKLGSAKNVIGWEILNEPFPGLQLPWDFENGPLSTLEAETLQAIRAEDPDRIVFFEPQLMAADLPTCGLQKLPDNNVVYAPHWYDPVVDVRAASGIAPFYDGDSSRTANAFTNVANHAKALGCPLWLGEWGIERKRSGSHEYVIDHEALLDERLMSHCYWELNPIDNDIFTPVDPSGNDYPIAADLARPHPRAVAGTLTKVHFDPTTSELQVEWTEGHLGPAAPTLIELPWKHFPQGAPLIVSLPEPNAHWEREPGTGRLAVWADPTFATHSLNVRPR